MIRPRFIRLVLVGAFIAGPWPALGDDRQTVALAPNGDRVVTTHGKFLGQTETAIRFTGGIATFPALSIDGVAQPREVYLRRRGRRVFVDWKTEDAPFRVELRGLRADRIIYEDGRVILEATRPDRSVTRLSLDRLHVTWTPWAEKLLQVFATTGVALTAVIAQPGSTSEWVFVTAGATIAAGVACSGYLSTGFQADPRVTVHDPAIVNNIY